MAFRPGIRVRLAHRFSLTSRTRLTALVSLLALAPLATLTLHAPSLAAQMPSDNKPSESGAVPPKTWVDKDTGHRVWRVSDEPNSGAFYFNVNAFTPDNRQMVYNSPDGIRVLDLATMTTRMLVPNPPAPTPVTTDAATGGQAGRGGRGFGGGARTIVVGHKTNSIFFTRMDPVTRRNAVYKADTDSGAVTKLIDLPPRVSISSVNADETLGAGTYNAADCPGGDPNAPHAFLAAPAAGAGRGVGAGGTRAQTAPGASAAGQPAAANPTLGGANVQSDDKGAMMERRLAAHIPVVLFTIRLTPGPNGEKAGHHQDAAAFHRLDRPHAVLAHRPQPADVLPRRHVAEGRSHLADPHRRHGQNTLIHKRTMLMEIAGHEFWGLDGKTIWYDWQYPKGEDFFLASYNLETHKRIAYHMQRNEWSIHFNLTKDLDLFCGDGGDSGQVAQAPDGEWIELFRPQMIGGTEGALNDPNFFQPGVFHSEHLVNMAHQNYRAEPNPRFSPDKKYVFFTSNMFGRSYVFAVEVAKATDLTTLSPRRSWPRSTTPSCPRRRRRRNNPRWCSLTALPGNSIHQEHHATPISSCSLLSSPFRSQCCTRSHRACRNPRRRAAEASRDSAVHHRLAISPGRRHGRGEAQLRRLCIGDRVTLPHDWSIAGPPKEDAPSRGAGAFMPTGIGWYRKTFTVPAADASATAARRTFVVFDGVMANSDVYLNGELLGHRPYGYVSFYVRADAAPAARQERALRCASTTRSSRHRAGIPARASTGRCAW